MSNIPKELADAASSELKFNPQDADTAALVKEFLAGKSDDRPGDGEAVPEFEDPKVNISPNREFDAGDPQQQFVTEAMAPVDQLAITEAEKEIFLKAVLNDEPARLPVSLYNGQFTMDLRSRSTFEQKRVIDVLKLDEKDRIYDQGDLAMMMTRTHYYLGSLMVERINGDSFSELVLKPGKSLEEDARLLREHAARLFESMTTLRWTSVLNGLRIFEHKCARMNSEAANEGFWNPQG